jgi:hypothetical protein
MENINNKIIEEVARKKNIMEMGETLTNAAEQLRQLNDDCCALFENRDENDVLNNMPALIRNFKMTHRVDPTKAELLIQSRAANFMNEWSYLKLADHHKTIDEWQDIWQINRNFEQDIM